jgi:hypothetical protein
MAHNVYVVELDRAVLAEARFREENPHYAEDSEKLCVYVGMTGLTPEERFRRHLAGIQSSRIVRKYGIRLRPRHYRARNPMSYDDAVAFERELARRLRKRGYAVWQK